MQEIAAAATWAGIPIWTRGLVPPSTSLSCFSYFPLLATLSLVVVQYPRPPAIRGNSILHFRLWRKASPHFSFEENRVCQRISSPKSQSQSQQKVQRAEKILGASLQMKKFQFHAINGNNQEVLLDGPINIILSQRIQRQSWDLSRPSWPAVV